MNVAEEFVLGSCHDRVPLAFIRTDSSNRPTQTRRGLQLITIQFFQRNEGIKYLPLLELMKVGDVRDSSE